MTARIPGFRGEYLWELDIARNQLLALAEAMPEEGYAWRAADDARSFAQVLAHIATINLGMLHLAGAQLEGEEDLYGDLQGDEMARITAMVRKNLSLEKTLTAKAEVTGLLRRSFTAVERAITAATEADLEQPITVFGEPSAARRIYMRVLAHSHEHMGQAIAYIRASGRRVPWPDPLKEIEGLD